MESKKIISVLKAYKNGAMNDEDLSDFLNDDLMDRKRSVLRAFVSYLFNIIESKHLNSALKLVDVIYKNRYENHRTLDSVFTIDVRNTIKKRFGQESKEYENSKKLLRLSYEDKGQLIKENNERVIDKNNKRFEYNYHDIHSLIRDLSKSDDIMKVALSLLLASGSRPFELFIQSMYRPYDFGNCNNWIEQSGIAKNKTGIIVIKPLIYYDNKTFINCVKKLRTLIDDLFNNITDNNGGLSKTIAIKLNKTTKEAFDDNDITTYISRKIYGSVAYELYGSNNPFGTNLSLSNFLNKVLGHAENSLSTTHNYTNIQIKL